MLLLTEKEMIALQRKNTERLFKTIGDYSHLAKMLGMSRVVVHNWQTRGRVSIDGVLRIKSHPLISRHISAYELRPDLDWYLKIKKNRLLEIKYKKLYAALQQQSLKK